MNIPKIVHYVWIGPRPLPDTARILINQWKSILSDYKFILWDEYNIDFKPKFIREAHGVRAYNRVANYARLAALYLYGGFYLDTDVELIKTLEPLRDEKCFFGFQSTSSDSDVNNAVIGAQAGHDFIRKALDALAEMDGSFEWGAMTGPGLVTRLLRESHNFIPQAEPYRVSGVTLYPARYFYPFEWDEQFSAEVVTPDTIAIHHWDNSWGVARSSRQRLQRQALRLLTRINSRFASRIALRSDLRKKRTAYLNTGLPL